MDSISSDSLASILEFLEPNELARVASASRALHHAANRPHIWRQKCTQHGLDASGPLLDCRSVFQTAYSQVERQRRVGRSARTLFGIWIFPLIAIHALLLFSCVAVLFQHWAIEHARPVTARIAQHTLRELAFTDDDGGEYFQYEFDIEYRYRVETGSVHVDLLGQQLTALASFPHPAWSRSRMLFSRDDMQALCARFPALSQNLSAQADRNADPAKLQVYVITVPRWLFWLSHFWHHADRVISVSSHVRSLLFMPDSMLLSASCSGSLKLAAELPDVDALVFWSFIVPDWYSWAPYVAIMLALIASSVIMLCCVSSVSRLTTSPCVSSFKHPIKTTGTMAAMSLFELSDTRHVGNDSLVMYFGMHVVLCMSVGVALYLAHRGAFFSPPERITSPDFDVSMWLLVCIAVGSVGSVVWQAVRRAWLSASLTEARFYAVRPFFVLGEHNQVLIQQRAYRRMTRYSLSVALHAYDITEELTNEGQTSVRTRLMLSIRAPPFVAQAVSAGQIISATFNFELPGNESASSRPPVHLTPELTRNLFPRLAIADPNLPMPALVPAIRRIWVLCANSSTDSTPACASEIAIHVSL